MLETRENGESDLIGIGFKPANKKQIQKQYHHTLCGECEYSTNVAYIFELLDTKLLIMWK